MRTITCDKCGGRLTEETVHELRIELTNAAQTVSATETSKSGDFCHACAARAFREFKEPRPEVVAA